MIQAYNPSAIDNLGAVLLRRGELEEAETLFREGLSRRPDFSSAHNNLGVVLLRKGDPAGALWHIRKALQENSRQANYQVNLGQALLQVGDLAGARRAWDTALSLDPDSAEALAGYGLIHERRGEREQAVRMFRRALALDMGSAQIHNNLAVSLIGLEAFAEALGHLDEAVRLKPDFADALFNRGVCLERLSRRTLAIDAYRAAIAIRATHARAHNNLGNLLSEAGDLPGAVAAYRNFLRHWRGDSAVRESVEREIHKLERRQ
jgi:Flp pilus assembly protein TadD